MGPSAWILLSLTIVVTVILLPQVAKSRRMLGQSRNDDRFSQGVRVLKIEETPQKSHTVEVALHPQSIQNPELSTRSISMAQDLRKLTDTRANRAAAATRRRAGAKRRAVLSLVCVTAALGGGILAGLSMAPWWILSLPLGLLGMTLSWGYIAANRGKAQDLEFIQTIRDLERNLENTPAGRAALHGWNARSTNHWARVASESLNRQAASVQIASMQTTSVQSGGAALDAAVQDKPDSRSDEQSELETATSAVEKKNHGGEKLSEASSADKSTVGAENLLGQSAPKQPKSASDAASAETRNHRGWDYTQIPAPTYTLQSGGPRYLSNTDALFTHTEASSQADLSVPTAEVAVPMRPRTAQFLPAGAALSSADLSHTPVDLQAILERRRVSGD